MMQLVDPKSLMQSSCQRLCSQRPERRSEGLLQEFSSGCIQPISGLDQNSEMLSEPRECSVLRSDRLCGQILGEAGSGSDSLKSDAKIVPISARPLLIVEIKNRAQTQPCKIHANRAHPQPEFHGFRSTTFSISARSGNLFKKERVGGRFPGPPSLS